MQLHAKHAHVDAVIDDDPSHVSFLCLPDAEDAAEGLLFDGVVPPEVEGDAAVGPGEVETGSGWLAECYGWEWDNGVRIGGLPETSTFQTGNQDLGILVFSESLDSLRAVVKRRVSSEVDEAPAFALADTTDDTGQGAKLDVDDDLG